MAEGTLTDPAFVVPLEAALQSRLPGSAISHEQVRRDRYRFIVISDEFGKMDHPERQQLVWKVAEEVVPKSDIWNVAMIITMAPAEVESPGAN
jgi:acid stress-induced BolA-like protein IbaG/YrbA